MKEQKVFSPRFLLRIKMVLSVLIFGYLGACVLLYTYQRDLLYSPTPEYAHNFASVRIDNQGSSIELIVLNAGNDTAVLYFGGKAESLVHSAEVYEQALPNHTIYMMNYRGYGGSSGVPSEQAIYSDALAVYDWIYTQHPTLSVIGRSLGTGVATYVAVNRDVHKMLLITPYDSIEQIAKQRYALFPVSLLIKDRYDSISRAANVKARTLMLLAENDRVIPRENSMSLVQAFAPPLVTVKTIKGVGHNSISRSKEFYSSIERFLRR